MDCIFSVWHGGVWRGMARRGVAWQTREARAVNRVKIFWRGRAWLDSALHGAALQGSA